MTDAMAKIEPSEVRQIEQPAGDPIISMIERAARDPNVDIDKMERLFQMHERVAAQQREAAFNAAMAAAQSEIRPVARKLENSQTHSKYADLAAVSDAIDPIIHAHGIGVISSEFRSDMKDHLGVRLTLTHTMGHSASFDFNIPVDGTGLKGNPNKTATHAYGSTITYGRRYAKCSVFDVATKNDTDGNAAAPTGMITPEQIIEIEALIVAAGADREWIMNHHGIGEFADMTGKDFQKAKAGLTARIRKMMEVAP